LADWLIDPNHPLTSRVMVNRIWLWLFGDGLVRSPDNFGTTGQPPTDPELLDFLASNFSREKWSIKAVIRSLVLSQTYAMASEEIAANQKIDPDNHLWHHFKRRRQDAESIRDYFLAAAGVIDLKTGGPNIEGASAIDANDNGAGSIEYNYVFKDTRRSVYTPAFRNKRLELFEAFDFADINQPIGQREQSIVATQALFLMNHPFVREMAEKTASRLMSRNLTNPAEKLDLLTEWVLARPSTPAERNLLLPVVKSAKSSDEELQVWSKVAHALFASIEFRYIN